MAARERTENKVEKLFRIFLAMNLPSHTRDSDQTDGKRTNHKKKGAEIEQRNKKIDEICVREDI